MLTRFVLDLYMRRNSLVFLLLVPTLLSLKQEKRSGVCIGQVRKASEYLKVP